MAEEYEAKCIGEVEDLGSVYQAAAPLHKQILALKDKGIQYPFLVTPEEAVMIRLAKLSNDFTRTCVAPVAVKGEKPILYKPSPFMDEAMAGVAVNAHSRSEYPLFIREFYECVKAIADSQASLEPEDRTAHILQTSKDYDLTPEMDGTRFIFGKHIGRYFEVFRHEKIPFYNLPTDNLPNDKCAVNYLWLSSPENGSDLYCRGRSLDGDIGAFGVLRKSAEGASASQNRFSLSEVKNAVVTTTPKTLETVGVPALKDILFGQLERDILETLRKQ